jgi:hypothetical protein
MVDPSGILDAQRCMEFIGLLTFANHSHIYCDELGHICRDAR